MWKLWCGFTLYFFNLQCHESFHSRPLCSVTLLTVDFPVKGWGIETIFPSPLQPHDRRGEARSAVFPSCPQGFFTCIRFNSVSSSVWPRQVAGLTLQCTASGDWQGQFSNSYVPQASSLAHWPLVARDRECSVLCDPLA